MDIIDLKSVAAKKSLVYTYDKEFLPEVRNHMENLLTSSSCQATCVVAYRMDLEEFSKGKAVEWEQLRDEDGIPITQKMPLMFNKSGSGFTAKIYVRKETTIQTDTNMQTVHSDQWQEM